jgi:hypothetical protein
MTIHIFYRAMYIARAKHKGSELTDLAKARWWLNHEIQRLERLAAASAHKDNESPSG